MGFENTAEYQQSERMRPACDRVLMRAFGIEQSAIERFPHGDKLFILDQEFAIDLRLTLPNGTTITGQEKALSFNFYKYRTFTMEFYQNRNTNERGEFFRIASQFYLSGYSDASGVEFIEWKIIDTIKLILWLRATSEEDLARRCRPSTSRANFLPIKYADIPSDCILFDSKQENQQQSDLDFAGGWI